MTQLNEMKRGWFKRRPTLREFPLELAKVAAAGAVAGFVISASVNSLVGSWDSVREQLGLFVLGSCGGGAVFAVTFWLTCALPIPYLKPYWKDLPGGLRGGFVALTAFLGGSLGLTIAVNVVRVLFAGRVTFEMPLPVRTMAVIDGLIAIGITAAVGLSLQRKTAREMLVAKAQASALQAQINPHFFFNTLNTISALIPVDPGAAQEMVGRLAEMFRYTLSSSRTELVELESELEFVRSYLEIEQARFGDRLKVELPATGAGKGVWLPGLSVQPLVENAVKYGIARRVEGGLVRVSLNGGSGMCRVVIRSPRDREHPPTVEEFFQPGHALANIRERLALQFEDRAAVRVGLEDLEWVDVSVETPK